METLTAWLSPAGRSRIYARLSGIGSILVVVGVVRQDVLTSWLGLVNAALGVAGLVMASINAKRVDITAVYAVAAVTIATLQAAGMLSDGTATRVTTVLAALAQVLGLTLAHHRTDTSTPTGEPAVEFSVRSLA